MKTYTRTEKNIEIVRTCVDFRRRTSGLSKQGEYDISKYGKCGGKLCCKLDIANWHSKGHMWSD